MDSYLYLTYSNKTVTQEFTVRIIGNWVMDSCLQPLVNSIHALCKLIPLACMECMYYSLTIYHRKFGTFDEHLILLKHHIIPLDQSSYFHVFVHVHINKPMQPLHSMYKCSSINYNLSF